MSQKFNAAVESVTYRNGVRAHSLKIKVDSVGLGQMDQPVFLGNVDEAIDLRDALTTAIAHARQIGEL
jgi:hypothetical protein